jgi:hypothetical protein
MIGVQGDNLEGRGEVCCARDSNVETIIYNFGVKYTVLGVKWSEV